MAIPTVTDKVILIDFTLPETNVFLLREYETNQQFSTLDVGSAFIGFKAPTETDLDGMTAKISLVNLDDDSFLNHTENIVSLTNHDETENTYYYQVRRAELERQGKWIGRVSFVDINGKTWGTRKFTFSIDGDILDVKQTKLHSIDSVENFMEDMSALMLDFNGLMASIILNESDRGTTFTTSMVDFTDLFNQAQLLRTTTFNASETGRTGDFNTSELNRTETFDASEASRTTTFNASETSRGNTFTQNENARQVEFDLGESTRNDGFDVDHDRAVTDHTTAVSDHTQAGNDHSTAITDHTTNLADHAIVGGYNTRLTTVESDTVVSATNLVTNGDFSNGTTGWDESSLLNLRVENGELVGDATTNSINAIMARGMVFETAFTSGTKYYLGISRRHNNAFSPSDFRIRLAFGTALFVGGSDHYFGNRASIIVECSTGGTAQAYIGYMFNTTSVYAGFKAYLDNAIMINLTATFGAGKEPTLAEMDRLMARYPNSWFDGTKPIQTIETLYQEKANKTQEAWITPTLLNGWTGTTMKYAKNDLNLVTLKLDLIAGTSSIGTAICTLPVGYRPTNIIGVRGNVASSGLNCDFRIQPSGVVEVISGVSSGNYVQTMVTFYAEQ